MSTDLVLAKIDKAKNFLMQATNLMEVNHVIAIASAAQTYARQVKASTETMNQASAIRLRAERRLGELLKVTEKNKGAKAGKTGTKGKPALDPTPTLAESGISKKLSSRAQELASVPEDEFEAAISISDGKELNHNRVVKDIKEKRQATNRQAKRKEAAAKTEPQFFDNVHIGDFRKLTDKVTDGSLSLIFTDPPYDKKAEELFEGLADFASDKLAEGGSLLMYLGHLQLRSALNAFDGKLRHWWTCACFHEGDRTLMREYGIRVGWKPMLWFVKGTRDDKQNIVIDVVSGTTEKSHHDWQQDQSEAAYWIENLCPTDGIVCDPFLGGGTTAAAAIALNRKWVGFEIDHDQACVAMARCKK